MQFLLTVLVDIDDEEVDTAERFYDRKRAIIDAVEGLYPGSYEFNVQAIYPEEHE
jgi:hypothetical protein